MEFPKAPLIILALMIPVGILALTQLPDRHASAAQAYDYGIPARPEKPWYEDPFRTFSGSNMALQLFLHSSESCANLMRNPKWMDAMVVSTNGKDSHSSPACWRQFANYELAWDNSHPGEPVVAVCPLIDGGRMYDGCMNVPLERFEIN